MKTSCEGRFPSEGRAAKTARLARALAAGLLVIGAWSTASAADAAKLEQATPPDVDLSFKDLGVEYPVRLRTVFGQASVAIHIPNDQIVTKAELDLRYSHSPALRTDISHLGVFVNNEAVDILAFKEATAAGVVQHLPIDPLLLLNRNELRFDFIGHYAPDNVCEDPTNTTLWAEISNASRVRLWLQPLDSTPTVSNLPAPWFDPDSSQMLSLPFVFTHSPGPEAVQAAGIVAAWFGQHADYRGADFPVSWQIPSKGNAVVFEVGATALGVPASTHPQVRALRNPNDPNGRLLVLSSPDEQGLIQVAQGLALSSATMSGESADIPALQLPPPQAEWTSSLWMQAEDGKIVLKPYLISPSTVSGVYPGPIQYDFKLAPDLYYTSNGAATIELRYRANGNVTDTSSLNIDINGEYLGSASIKRAGKPSDGRLLVSVPSGLLRAQNRLTAQFYFPRDISTACEDFRSEALQGAIEPESAISLGRHYHYAEMPALKTLVDGGFPFSKYADLSRTALVIPDRPSAQDLSAAMTLLGHIGRWTHSPAIHLLVVGQSELSLAEDRDLLIISPGGFAGFPDSMNRQSPLTFGAEGIELRLASQFEVLQGLIENRQIRDAEEYAHRALVRAGNEIGAIVEFQSPFDPQRTVVALMSADKFDIAQIARAFIEPSKSQFIYGGLALISNESITAYDLGSRYHVGHLPLWLATLRWLSLHPYLLVPMALVVSFLLAWLIIVALKRIARRRLSPSS